MPGRPSRSGGATASHADPRLERGRVHNQGCSPSLEGACQHGTDSVWGLSRRSGSASCERETISNRRWGSQHPTVKSTDFFGFPLESLTFFGFPLEYSGVSNSFLVTSCSFHFGVMLESSDGSKICYLNVFNLDGKLVSSFPPLTSDGEGRLGCTGERGDFLPGFALIGGAVHLELVGERSHQG